MAQQTAAAAQQEATVTTAGSQSNESGSAKAQVQPGNAQLNVNTEGSATSPNLGHTNGAPNGSASATGEMRSVSGELQGKLDSKSAKVGDTVMVKTTEKMRMAGGTVIPKGSRLVGHVTEVQAHASGHAESRLAFAFDQAELKGGQNIAIHSMLQSVLPPARAMAVGQMSSDDSLSTPMADGGIAGDARAMGSGGLRGGSHAGGLLGGTVSSTSSASGRGSSDLGSIAGSAVRTTDGVAGGATAGVKNGVRGTAGATGLLTGHSTGISGLMLTGDVSGATSGTLSASKGNIHLDSGTQMVFTLSAAGK